MVARWTAGNSSKSGEPVAIRIGQNDLHRNWKAVWMRDHAMPEILVTCAEMLSFGQSSRKKRTSGREPMRPAAAEMCGLRQTKTLD